jgi:hypothetical protein
MGLDEVKLGADETTGVEDGDKEDATKEDGEEDATEEDGEEDDEEGGGELVFSVVYISPSTIAYG